MQIEYKATENIFCKFSLCVVLKVKIPQNSAVYNNLFSLVLLAWNLADLSWAWARWFQA